MTAYSGMGVGSQKVPLRVIPSGGGSSTLLAGFADAVHGVSGGLHDGDELPQVSLAGLLALMLGPAFSGCSSKSWQWSMKRFRSAELRLWTNHRRNVSLSCGLASHALQAGSS